MKRRTLPLTRSAPGGARSQGGTARAAAAVAPGASAPKAATPAVDVDVIARATERVLANRRSAAVRTDDRGSRYTVADLDAQARDNGVDEVHMERRRESMDRGARILRDAAQGIQRDDQGRAPARSGSARRYRQFTEMSGGRSLSLNKLGEPDLRAAGDAGLGFAGWLRYHTMANGDSETAWKMAKRDGADARLVRALGESTMAAGGALVPEDMVDDYIELLYASTVYLQGNPVRMPAPNGNLTIPKITAGVTGGWEGENANATASQPTFGSVRANLKYVSVLTPVSNRLIAHAPYAVESIIRDDLVSNAAVLIDTAAIRGSGTAHQPLGLKNRANNTFAANGTVNVANVTADLSKCQRLLEDDKIKFIRPYWMFSPRSRWWLMSARDGNNNIVWATEMAGGTLYGKPFGVTQSIPDNLGGGTESELYLVEMMHQIFAEGVGEDGLKVKAVDGAAYYDGSAVVSGFSQDQTVVKLKQSCDIVSRQDGNEICLLSAVTWGA